MCCLLFVVVDGALYCRCYLFVVRFLLVMFLGAWCLLFVCCLFVFYCCCLLMSVVDGCFLIVVV